ncbi:unnamed protein product [Owenia fusiformis]|uniref:4-aminobutyrate aminotransferase n=1 Tax=Owenia fusiformis TaxID=6347 RepID=A0A8S4PKN0_OWEFU|nr:unnamed protein product [Owenia fusiformis]
MLQVWPSSRRRQTCAAVNDPNAFLSRYGLNDTNDLTFEVCNCPDIILTYSISAISLRRKQRGGSNYSDEEKETAVFNQAPGCPNLTILSFKGGFHGRTMASLLCTHTKWVHKLDFPSLDWPMADFPKLKYPLEDNVAENAKEEQRCLDQVAELFDIYNKRGNDVAGVIVEPIQAEGGDNYASPNFFKELQKIIKKNNSYMVVDEVQTGAGATGEMWYHETWGLPTPPDAVTFSKKMMSGGYYYTDELRPTEGYRVFNTWMGDPSKVLFLEEMIEIMKDEDLLAEVTRAGNKLVDGLNEIQGRHPDVLSATRGGGVFVAVDCKDASFRDKLIAQLRNAGIHTGGCGDNSLRFRPMLIFQEKHANIALDTFETTLKKLL